MFFCYVSALMVYIPVNTIADTHALLRDHYGLHPDDLDEINDAPKAFWAANKSFEISKFKCKFPRA